MQQNETLDLMPLRRWREAMGISRVTVWRWERRKFLTTVKISGQRFISRAVREEFERRAKAGEFAD